MKKVFFLKRFLAVFAMVLGLGFMNTATAQKPHSQDNAVMVTSEIGDQNLTSEIISLKSSLQTLTPGSAEYVDAMRRVETFGTAAKVIQSGEPVEAGLSAAKNYLYRVLETKESENALLVQIEEDLWGLLSN